MPKPLKNIKISKMQWQQDKKWQKKIYFFHNFKKIFDFMKI